MVQIREDLHPCVKNLLEQPECADRVPAEPGLLGDHEGPKRGPGGEGVSQSSETGPSSLGVVEIELGPAHAVVDEDEMGRHFVPEARGFGNGVLPLPLD